MKILQINKFHYLKGGAEKHVFALSNLLRQAGHEIIVFSMSDENNEPSPYEKYFSDGVSLEKFSLKNIFKLFHNREAAKKLESLIKAEKPDIAHLHNISHQLSSSIIRVLKKYGIPIAQTLHDYKLICPNYKLFDGKSACGKCRGGKYYNCFFKKCVKKSYLKSALASLEAYYNGLMKNYGKIDLFIAPSAFMKNICESFGISADKIITLNNFTDKFEADFIGGQLEDKYLLYCGRLSEEKGIEVLVRAMPFLDEKIKLKIIGAGPDFFKIKNLIEKLKLEDKIQMLGPKFGMELNNYVSNSEAVVIPSIWPENFPYVILESLSAGKPVIASNIGGLKEMVKSGENGFLFEAGNVESLAGAIGELLDADKEQLSRAAFLSSKKYNPEIYSREIIKIYENLMNKREIKTKFKKISAAVFLLFMLCSPVSAAQAFYLKNSFPKIANYYLNPIIPEQHAGFLNKYDLIILDAEVPRLNSGLLPAIKAVNPKAQILAYVPSQSVNTQGMSDWSEFRRKNYQVADSGNWWLRDSRGNIISFNQTWPTIKFVDVGSGWKNYLPDFASNEILKDKNWDGIFYDMVFANLSWLNNGDVKIADNNLNGYWNKNMDELLENTKIKIAPKPVIANLDIAGSYKGKINGEMMENFPAKWLGDGGWAKLMKVYLRDNDGSYVYIINSNSDNNNFHDNYRNMRFGLTSALLGDGYFSYDMGDQNHAQIWWYDEFDVNLGIAESKAYNLLDPAGGSIKNGLWRRDFANGIAINNSTPVEQTYAFNMEEFEKINGTQDRIVNNGQKINWFKLKPNDGFIALKINKEIENSAYVNGGFVRVFNISGKQTKNGFFAYRPNMVGGIKILSSDIDNDGMKEILSSGNGGISASKNGKIAFSFNPFGNFKLSANFAVAKLNKNQNKKQIIAGAGQGGGPQIRIFNDQGKLLSGGFFAFDKNFRGGVNVAAGDLNGDGKDEIIAGAGQGGGPQIRIFNDQGKLMGQFFASDPKNRQGAYVSSYDLDGDKIDEILVNINIF